MKNINVIDKQVSQWKGNLHLHTDRSHDSKAPYLDVLKKHKEEGYHFVLVSDHEIYWDSHEADSEGFLALSGAETILKTNPVREFAVDSRRKFIHINMIKDETRTCNHPFEHNERLLRCYDQGLDCMNEYIRYLVEDRGQIVQMNHPDWSRMEPEILLATQHCFAFEIYNNSAFRYVGCQTDDWRWDYCLQRGRKLLATGGDDSHRYEDDRYEFGGGFTMVQTDDFSRKGLVQALKDGRFYASMGPVIKSMKIQDGFLLMEFTDAAYVQIVGHGNAGFHNGGCHGKGFSAAPGKSLDQITWQINSNLTYFRIRIVDKQGRIAWSQPVFLDDIIEHPPIEGRETRNPTWLFPRYLDEIKAIK